MASERALRREGERASREERDDARRSEDEGENERETTVGRVKAEGDLHGGTEHPSLPRWWFSQRFAPASLYLRS